MSERLVVPAEETTQEVPQDLRMLRQLGNYAAREIIIRTPVFKKFSEGTLTEEQQRTIGNQLDYMQQHIRHLAVAGIDLAQDAKSYELSHALQEVSVQLPVNHKKNSLTFIRPETLKMLEAVNGLSAGQNYIRIGAGVYALLRMARSERLMVRQKSDPEALRVFIHNLVKHVAPDEIIRAPSTALNAFMALAPGIEDEIEAELIAKLEDALRVYITSRSTFQDGIMKGLDEMVDAKKRFYQSLALDFQCEKDEGLKPGMMSLSAK